jgi:hypothetical protein
MSRENVAVLVLAQGVGGEFDLVSEGIEYEEIPLSLAEKFRKETGKPMVF